MQMLLSAGALKVFNKALELNRRYFLKHSFTVGSDQMFLAFIELKHPLATALLGRFGVKAPIFVRSLCQGILSADQEAIEKNAREYFGEVNKRVAARQAKLTAEWDLFETIFDMVASSTVVQLLRAGVNYNQIRDYLQSDPVQQLAAPYQLQEGMEAAPTLDSNPPAPSLSPLTSDPLARAYQKSPPPVPSSSAPGSASGKPALAPEILGKFARNLTDAAKQRELPPIFFRDDVILQMMEVLCRAQERNVLLIGDTGVGKTAVVQGLARRLQEADCPERLRGRVLYQLNLATLLSGTSMRGSFEERVSKLVEETSKARDRLVFFEEFDYLFEDHDQEGALQILLPAMASGGFQCIGAVSPESYRRHFENNSAFMRCFSAVRVEPPTADETVEILAKLTPAIQQFHKVTIGEDAIRAAVEFSDTYLKQKAFPGKAIAVLDGAAARVSLEPQRGQIVHREDVAEVVSRQCNIPASRILATRVQSVAQLEEFLRSRIVGQDRAIRSVVDTIQVNRSGLGLRAQRPDGVFLLVGPTGVGKTELAKSVSEGLTGSADKLIRFDMSEFDDKHTASKLIGSPPGYIGHEEEGQLTSAVRANPEAVILFDEIEKAHPDITRLFLQIFDDGRLTDSHGVTADFSQTIIFMTSNLGVKDLDPAELARLDGPQKYAYLQEALGSAVRSFFSPELLNRLDEILYLDFLSAEVINRIAQKRLTEVAQRVADRGMGVDITGPAFDFIVREGYSPEFGARHLNRTIENRLLKPLAKFLLDHDGAGKLVVDLDDSGASIELKAAESGGN